jgi:hypothetical protein
VDVTSTPEWGCANCKVLYILKPSIIHYSLFIIH